MAEKVKCFYCNKEIESKDDSVKLFKGGKIYYFCSQEHLEEFLKMTSTPSC